ncbi:MAG TPA: sugar kinase [Actinomycetota bacterium]|nr:sugar kinase [Actinomycetota bacterium]
MTAPSVVTFGEAMALLTSEQVGPLRAARTFSLSVAGAESNVAVGLRRLGIASAWCGRLGDDELGRMIVERLRAEQVDVRGVTWSRTEPTGLMLKERRTSETVRVVYYRRGSAASRIEAGHLDPDLIRSAAVLHLTGITPALSERAAAAVWLACDIARKADVLISVDVNHRSALWGTDEAVPVLRELVGRSDIVFATAEEASMILGSQAEPDALAARLVAMGAQEAVVKTGESGAVALAAGRVYAQEARRVTVVDPVGAGDAFVAGYLAGWLEEAAPADRLRQAVDMGSYAVTVPGDCDGLPTREELAAFGGPDIQR